MSYAKRNYTSTGDADVEFWPKPPSLEELFSKAMSGDKGGTVSFVHIMWSEVIGNAGTLGTDTVNALDLVNFLVGGGISSPTLLALSANTRSPEPMLTIDANEAIGVALGQNEWLASPRRHILSEYYQSC